MSQIQKNIPEIYHNIFFFFLTGLDVRPGNREPTPDYVVRTVPYFPSYLGQTSTHYLTISQHQLAFNVAL